MLNCVWILNQRLPQIQTVSNNVMKYLMAKGVARSKTRAPFQYPIRRLIVRSREVSKPRDRQFKLSYRYEIWQARRQQWCLSNFRAIGLFWIQISRHRDFTRSYDKTSYRILKRDPALSSRHIGICKQNVTPQVITKMIKTMFTSYTALFPRFSSLYHRSVPYTSVMPWYTVAQPDSVSWDIRWYYMGNEAFAMDIMIRINHSWSITTESPCITDMSRSLREHEAE